MIRLREIFPSEKIDINVFLKHQCDISTKNELFQNYMYVPKLLSKTFMKLLDLNYEDSFRLSWDDKYEELCKEQNITQVNDVLFSCTDMPQIK